MRMTSMRVLVLAAVLPAGAAWAQSSHADIELIPRDLGLAPPAYWLSRSMYFCVAGN